ncbi:RNA-dependent RNA polymerase [Nigrospora oryzae victorivirus 1]|uniref:RNA-directed RNA polymerase n=1 Tax=Nigrospora oryzae victorivirus 1 TaxID=1765736 RepID=A0A0S3IRQ6_9VIRU|nr:RNA-dependent RNA polymerase [Nigrospora oryzae victorivirus 1]ALR68225.1 RNA-dependent RNA polymerase [Nigrospora oryzae victorivirus 1]
MGQRATERGNDPPSLGQALERVARRMGITAKLDMPFADQISFIYRPQWDGRPVPRLARAAVSYLYCDVPVQVPLEKDDLTRLLGYLCEHLTMPPSLDRQTWVTDKKRAMEAFPPKRRAMALTKANIFLDEVARDLDKHMPARLLALLPYLGKLRGVGATHDQATAFLLYSSLLSDHCPLAAEWGLFALTQPKEAKEVSNFLKAVGANASSYGALLVETDTLLGRDTPGTDLVADSRRRCDLELAREEVLAEFDDSALRSAVRRVLRHELRSEHGSYRIEYPTQEDHWTSRWSWAVNGSHSALLAGEFPVPNEVKRQVHKLHRRAWLETIERNPCIGWDGKTFVSCAPKPECGKIRAIYACDTINYLAFEHLMAGVESRWLGKRVILNPGRGGHLGIAERVAACRSRSGISAMLDYDDFNSHHTTKAMQILIEETAALTGYPPELTKPLLDSFEKEDIYLDGKLVGRVKGTLMSGHRCTTYVNSVLNMAYLMVVLGEDWVMERQSLHVGDDVYMGLKNYGETGWMISKIMGSRLRMNRRKQSVGHVSTEFLRVASDARDSYGYLARAAANLIAGNWYSDKLLNPSEGLITMIQGARTLANRARNGNAPLLLESAVKRVLGADCPDDATLRHMLTGSAAVNDGPQYLSSGRHRRVRTSVVFEVVDTTGYATLPDLASKAYLAKHASPLEIATLTSSGIDPLPTMRKSSWTKSLALSDRKFETIVFKPMEQWPAVGSVQAEHLLRERKPHGVLLKYPLLVLMRDRIPEPVLRVAVAAAGGRDYVDDISLEAWGDYSNPTIVNTVLSYSDASMLSKRASVSVLTSRRRCYV